MTMLEQAPPDALLAHLTDPQLRLYEETRRVARDLLAPVADQGEEGRINRRLVRALGEHGLLRRLYDPVAAQHEISAMDLCLIREALARESTAAETAFALQGLGSYPLLQAGRPEIVEEWMPLIASGEAVAAFALTEPNAGSDVAAMELRAEPVAGGYELSGVKTYISNAPEADIYTIFASTNRAAGSRGVTAFALVGDAPGLGGVALDLLSPHPIGRLELDHVFVSDEQVLGEVDAGFRVAMRTLDLFRPSVGAFAIGMAQAALDAALTHAAERQAFGRKLREFQAVSHSLAEMATRIQAARLLIHAAADASDHGRDQVTLQVAMAKLFATETAQQVVDTAVQVHGARALERGHILEHLYRDVRAPRIYEGTSEIQREIIARQLFATRE